LDFLFDEPGQINLTVDDFTPELAADKPGSLHLLAELAFGDAAIVRRLRDGEVVLAGEIGHDALPIYQVSVHCFSWPQCWHLASLRRYCMMAGMDMHAPKPGRSSMETRSIFGGVTSRISTAVLSHFGQKTSLPMYMAVIPRSQGVSDTAATPKNAMIASTMQAPPGAPISRPNRIPDASPKTNTSATRITV